MPETSSLLRRVQGSPHPTLSPTPAPLRLHYPHVPAGSCVRAGDRWQEAGKDPVEPRRPQAMEPSCHLLSVPIRRAFSLTGYFICVYLSVCLCLALSSDVSVSQPSDVPSAAAGISEDRRNWHLSPTRALATGSCYFSGSWSTPHEKAKSDTWLHCTLQFALLSPTHVFNYIPALSRRSPLCSLQ